MGGDVGEGSQARWAAVHGKVAQKPQSSGGRQWAPCREATGEQLFRPGLAAHREEATWPTTAHDHRMCLWGGMGHEMQKGDQEMGQPGPRGVPQAICTSVPWLHLGPRFLGWASRIQDAPETAGWAMQRMLEPPVPQKATHTRSLGRHPQGWRLLLGLLPLPQKPRTPDPTFQGPIYLQVENL